MLLIKEMVLFLLDDDEDDSCVLVMYVDWKIAQK